MPRMFYVEDKRRACACDAWQWMLHNIWAGRNCPGVAVDWESGQNHCESGKVFEISTESAAVARKIMAFCPHCLLCQAEGKIRWS